MTNVYNKGKKGTSKDTRSNGIWLWLAVSVGKGTMRYTHANGLKKVAFRILPKKEDAKHKKPRGLEEIKTSLQQHVARGSFLIFDKWKATITAVARLGYRSAPPVNHKLGWRNPDTGHHTNDVESENARVKKKCTHALRPNAT